MCTRAPALLVALTLLTAGRSALAKPAGESTGEDHGDARVPSPLSHTDDLPPRTDLAPDQKRMPQDYGRPPPEASTAARVAWIPRVLFSPIYFVAEYLVRKPIGGLVSYIERKRTVGEPSGEPTRTGVAPTALVDVGLRPRIGLYFFQDDFLADANALRLVVTTGGSRSLRASLIDRIPLRVDERGVVTWYLQAELEASSRPDLPFFGIGYVSSSRDRGQYEALEKRGGARLHAGLWHGSFYEAWLRAREARFTDGDCERTRRLFLPSDGDHCKETSLLEQVGVGRYPVPPGFEHGYALVEAGTRFVLDTRTPRPAPGSGLRIEVHGAHASVLSGTQHGSFVTYGASVAGFLDITGTRRVLGLTFDARSSDALTRHFDIPFTELRGPHGGSDAPGSGDVGAYMPELDTMRGFFPGRLVGKSSLAASLDYQWPVWSFLDGTIQASVGNVFDAHLRDLVLDRLRFSFATGITTFRDVDHQLNLLLGFGTRPFDHGGEPESLRLLLGGTTGF